MPDHDHPDRTRPQILESLEASSQATTAELAAALDTHPVTIERHCRALQQAGDIRQCLGGVYTLAESDIDRDAATTLADAPADHPTSTNPAD